jgi:putative hydrolase of the HAD superfamily
VAGDIGVPLGRILFFDDTTANVDGARAAGVQAVHVRGPEDVRAAVARWL